MQYELEIGGRTRRVVVQRAGDRFEVAVDGRLWHVDAARIDAYTLSLIVQEGRALTPPPEPDRRGPAASYEVTVAPDPATGLLNLRVGSTPVVVALNGRRRFGRRDEGGQAGSAPQRIVAPMPGKIVRVAVKTGEAVRARQTLVVIEAMKMENELRAGRDGTVGELQVREGQSVEAGALLVVVL